jgi:hypothetical protein
VIAPGLLTFSNPDDDGTVLHAGAASANGTAAFLGNKNSKKPPRPIDLALVVNFILPRSNDKDRVYSKLNLELIDNIIKLR